MSLQEKEAYDLAKGKLAEYLQDSAVCYMDEYVQHGTTSTLQHCLSVVHISCAMAEKLHIRVNYENLIVGALLHDFYLYDWHTHQDEGSDAVSRQRRGTAHHHHPYVAADAAVCATFQRGGSGLHGGQVLFYPRDRGGIFPRCRCTAPKKAGVSLWYIIFLTM